MFRLLLATTLVATSVAQQYGSNQNNYNQQPAAPVPTKQAAGGNYANDGAAGNYGNQGATGYGAQAAPTGNYGSQAAPSGNYGKQQAQTNYGRNNDYNNGKEGEGMPYEFSWFVKDDPTQNDYAHSEKSDGKLVTGSYRVLLPDGRTQIVTYRVEGDSGFVADVKYEGEARVDNSYAQKPVTQQQKPAQNYRPQVQSNNNYAQQNNAPQNGGYVQQAAAPQQSYVAQPAPAPAPVQQQNYAPQPSPAAAPVNNYQAQAPVTQAPAFTAPAAPAPVANYQQNQAPLPAPAYGGQGQQSQAFGQASSAGYAVATASAQSYAPAPQAQNFQGYTAQNNQNNYGAAGSTWPTDAKVGQRTYRHLNVPEDVDVYDDVFGKRTGSRKISKLI